jgi:lysophospholipase L1-like esterase
MTSFARATCTFILAALVAAVAWEVVSRNFLFYSAEPKAFPDGSQYYTGRSVRWKEGYSRLEFDKDGYRKPVPKGQHAHKVLCIGDSFTQGAQVGDDDVYVRQSEELLKKVGVDAAFYNAGGAGLSPTAYIGLGPHYSDTLHPDTVVVQVNEPDFREDRRDMTRVYAVKDDGTNFTLVKNKANASGVFGPKALRKIPGAVSIMHLANKSSLFQTMLANTTKGDPVDRKKKKKSADKNQEDAIVRRYVPWAVTELKKAYPNLVIVFIPGMDYFKPNDKADVAEAIMPEVCREQRVPLVSMRSVYLDYFHQTGVLPHGFPNTTPGTGHINAIGHRLLAEQLSKTLEELWAGSK